MIVVRTVARELIGVKRMRDMRTKILSIYYKIKYLFSRERCYDEMRERGYANQRKCCGVMGGNGFTNYLNESCINCPYLNLR